MTPLIAIANTTACTREHVRCARLLLELGADVTKRWKVCLVSASWDAAFVSTRQSHASGDFGACARTQGLTAMQVAERNGNTLIQAALQEASSYLLQVPPPAQVTDARPSAMAPSTGTRPSAMAPSTGTRPSATAPAGATSTHGALAGTDVDGSAAAAAAAAAAASPPSPLANLLPLRSAPDQHPAQPWQDRVRGLSNCAMLLVMHLDAIAKADVNRTSLEWLNGVFDEVRSDAKLIQEELEGASNVASRARLVNQRIDLVTLRHAVETAWSSWNSECEKVKQAVDRDPPIAEEALRQLVQQRKTALGKIIQTMLSVQEDIEMKFGVRLTDWGPPGPVRAREVQEAFDKVHRCCGVLSCPVLSCPVLSCPVLSCAVLSCPVLSGHG